MDENNRRDFIKKLLCGVFSAPLASKILLSEDDQKNRIKKGEMFYRRLGRTGLYVSEISLGGSPLPDWAILLQVIERGVNYIDTSHTYQNGNSERTIGRLFKELGRDKINVATKFHIRRNWNYESIIQSVNGSLKRLQTDYLDVLLVQGVENENALADERLIRAFETLKKEGKYRFRGVSCHSNHHKVVTKAVESDYFDMILLGYNVFDIQDKQEKIEVYDDYLEASGIRRLISLAKSKDIGMIAMKTLKVGGRRQNLEKYKTGSTTTYQAMLKWVLENKYISSALIEMLTYDQMEEDMAVIGHLE